MNSFNVNGQTSETIGGNTPVWLGTVKPIPVGGLMRGTKGTHNPAGLPVLYDASTKTTSICIDVEDAIAKANGYLYNDFYVDEVSTTDSEFAGTCAVVMHHPEGLLIERVFPEITKEQIAQLQAKIPGVLLVRG